MKKALIRMAAIPFLGLVPDNALADNPIFQTYYSPDPAPVVIDDTVFCYTGNDEGGSFFTMNGWRVSSTTDMVNWTDRGTIILSHDDFPNAKVSGDWAAQCIRRNGKYYYYVTVESTLGGRAINVAVADSPEGPFKNALGDKHLAGPNWDYIDPTVFIDDDGQAYLMWGNPKLYYAKLNADMVSFDGPIQVFDMTSGFAPAGENSKYTEGPWLMKRDSKWYMVYASHGVPECISYSWSNSPTGPWEWKGVIMNNKQSGLAFTNHSGIIDFKGRSFFFYHNQGLPGGGGYSRSTCVEEFTYNPDGTIPEISATSLGVVNPIHFLDPYKRVEAETKSFSYGLEAGKNDNGIYMTKIHNNDYIKVRCVDFGDLGADLFTAYVAGKADATLEIHLDKKDGDLLGTLTISNTYGAWKEVECEIANTTGKHDVFFVFKGAENTELFDFDYWFFESNSVLVPQAPYGGEAHKVPGTIQFEDFDEGGQNRSYYDNDRANQGGEYRTDDRIDIVKNDESYAIGYTNAGEWMEYTIDVKKTQTYDFEARVSCGLNTSGFKMLVDDQAITDTVVVPNTPDWDTYTTIKGTTTEIAEGEHVLKVQLTGTYANLDWIQFLGEDEESGIGLIANTAVQYPLQVAVYGIGGQKLGKLTLNSADVTAQVKAAGYTAGTYLLKGNGYSKVVVCK